MPSTRPWFRFYSEAMNDRKIARIVKRTGCDKALVMGVWVGLLCLSNESPERGTLMLTDVIPYTDEDLAEEVGCDLKSWNRIRELLLTLGMLDYDEADEVYSIKNWNGRQFESDYSTERVRKHRAKKDETLPKRSTPKTLKRDKPVIEQSRADTESDTEQRERENSRAPGPGSNHPAVRDYMRITGAVPNATQIRILEERIGLEDTGEGGEWEKTLDWWCGNGYRIQGVDNLTDAHIKGARHEKRSRASPGRKSNVESSLDAVKSFLAEEVDHGHR